MSVIAYNHEDFDALYGDLVYGKDSCEPFFRLTREEMPDYRSSKYLQEQYKDEEEYRRTILQWWLQRLYIANQMAHAFQYQTMVGESKATQEAFMKQIVGSLGVKEDQIEQAEIGNPSMMYVFPQPRNWQPDLPRPLAKTASDLRMLDYNLAANSGSMFCSEDDHRRLERLTHVIESHIADVHNRARADEIPA